MIRAAIAAWSEKFILKAKELWNKDWIKSPTSYVVMEDDMSIPKYVIMFKGKRPFADKGNETFDNKNIAEQVAEEMNKRFPGIIHWVEEE